MARTGSTTAASADIALSQSATSAAVNELERLLSLRLGWAVPDATLGRAGREAR